MTKNLNRRFATYAWGVMAYNILVILWGAFVRATGSGAGCGSHWPLCNGQVIPRPEQVETLIEFTHRLTSGLAGILVIILLVWAFRAYPRRHGVRKAAAFSMLLILTEGLVGAGLVLFEWVGTNDSIGRVISMAVHLNNTYLLLAALSLTAWWATTIPRDRPGRILRAAPGRKAWLLGAGLLAMMVVSTAGAVTALGDTLFPAESLAAGIAADFSPTAHFLVRLRVWHPLLAILASIYLFILAATMLSGEKQVSIRYLGRALQGLLVVQLVAGLVNVLLLAPVWMQLVHLLLADMVWIALILLAATTLALPLPASEPIPAGTQQQPPQPALQDA
jgi:heme A synthase